MVMLGAQVREQFGKLGIPPEALSAQLGELTPGRLQQLARLRSLDARAAVQSNRFAAGLRDGRVHISKAFSNPSPAAARAALEPFVGSTYGTDAAPQHRSAHDPLPHLLHPRRSRAARMTLAVARRPELRERVGTAVGAVVAADGRTDGVISVERGGRSARAGQRSARGPSLPPPTQSYGTGSIWEVMMAMDQAILREAAALGLGQGSGVGGTTGVMEAMGLWSLSPDDGDPSQWMGFGASSSGATASGMSGVPQPTNSATGTNGPESENSGLDVQIMRVKRMIDKKSQMMELYSQTLSKYNSSANAIIGNMKG